MPTPEDIATAVKALAAELNSPGMARVLEGDPEWTEVYSGDGFTFVITVDSAEIEESGYGAREERIKPEVHVVSAAPIKLFGRTFTVDVTVRPHWYGKVTPAVESWFIGGGYGGGYRNTANGARPDHNTATDKKLDAMVTEAIAWFNARHPGWMAESAALGWEAKADGEHREMANLQEKIKKAQAKAQGYAQRADKARAGK